MPNNLKRLTIICGCLAVMIGTGGCLTTMAVFGAAGAVSNNADKYHQQRQEELEKLAQQEADKKAKALQNNPPPLKRINVPNNNGFFQSDK